jgi:hypothetical protein
MLVGVLAGLLFALGAAVLNSVAGLLQSDATHRVHGHRRLIAQPRYLAGLAVDGLGWACTVMALRHLPVFAVQAVQGGSIALTAVLARMVYGSALRTVDRVAIVACVVGLGLAAGGAGAGPPPSVSATTDAVLCAAMVLLAAAAVGLWRRRRAWPLAVVAGLAFGATSVAVRAVHLRDGDPVELLTQPGPYVVVGFWAVGMSSYSRALALGNLAQVTAVFLVTEVVVPGLVGIALLGDSVRAGWWGPMVVGLLLAVGGVAVLAGSPAHRPPRPAADGTFGA